MFVNNCKSLTKMKGKKQKLGAVSLLTIVILLNNPRDLEDFPGYFSAICQTLFIHNTNTISNLFHFLGLCFMVLITKAMPYSTSVTCLPVDWLIFNNILFQNLSLATLKFQKILLIVALLLYIPSSVQIVGFRLRSENNCHSQYYGLGSCSTDRCHWSEGLFHCLHQ